MTLYSSEMRSDIVKCIHYTTIFNEKYTYYD